MALEANRKKSLNIKWPPNGGDILGNQFEPLLVKDVF